MINIDETVIMEIHFRTPIVFNYTMNDIQATLDVRIWRL